MLSRYFLCSLIIIAATLVTRGKASITNHGKLSTAVLSDVLDKKITAEHLVEKRQSNAQECRNQLVNSIPSSCNITLLDASDLSNIPSSVMYTDAQLTELNAAYSRFCSNECISPILNYYRCLNIPTETQNFLITLYEKGICGQESGDYCEVRYIRQYHSDLRYISRLTSSCSFGGTGVSCGTSSTCINLVSDFSSNMGCCTEPYLGSGVRSCSGVSVDEACTGVSSAHGLAPIAVVSMLILALAGFFF